MRFGQGYRELSVRHAANATRLGGLLLKLVLLVMLSQPGASALWAQDIGPINTERPSFSSSPLALPAGFWQIEAGYEYTRNLGSSSSKERTLPNALLRFGIRPRFELQLNWTGYERTTRSSADSDGVTDASLGLKWQLSADGAPLVFGLFAGISLPVGDTDLTSDDYDPELAVFWTYSGGLDWFGTAKLTDSGGKYKLENAVGMNFSLAQNTGAYLEYKGSFPEGQGPAHDLNFGVTWLLSTELQVDLHGGLGLNSRASDYVVGTGIAYRF